MQKTAKKTAPVPIHANAYAAASLNPLRQITADSTWMTPAFQNWDNIGQAYQPTITWQDTTSNATYSSASNVLAGAGGTLAVRQHADVLERLSET